MGWFAKQREAIRADRGYGSMQPAFMGGGSCNVTAELGRERPPRPGSRGSGATAVTLVPAMETPATHVTMLQRSPTYIISRPGEDPIANWLRRRLPARVAYGITRWKNVLLGLWFYRFCRRNPQRARALITKWVHNALGPDYDIRTHFEPRSNPGEQ